MHLYFSIPRSSGILHGNPPIPPIPPIPPPPDNGGVDPLNASRSGTNGDDVGCLKAVTSLAAATFVRLQIYI